MADPQAREALASASQAPAHAWPGDSVGYLVWRAHLVFRRAFDEGLAELDVTKTPERSGRAMDHEAEDAFERLRVSGYL